MTAPCLGCPARRVGCHGKCWKYHQYQKALHAEREFNRKCTLTDFMNLTHEQEKKNREKRYKGGEQ